MTGDLFVLLLVFATFILLGLIFRSGRGARLIAGYNTLPRETREQYDERALCRFMGRLMFYCAACIGLFALDEIRPHGGYGLAGGIWIGAGLIFALVYANTGDRFRKK